MGGTAEFTASWTPVGADRVHALTARAPGAAGPPVVLVHGYGVSGRYWRPLASRLSEWFPVYLPDLPGHGRSSTPAATLAVPGLVEALVAWMTAVGLERAVILGNSLGCQVAAELAAHEPERVLALVLAGPTVDPLARSAGRQCGRLLLSAPVEHPAILPLILGDYLRMGVSPLLAELRHMLAHRIERVLPMVSAPTLVLRGTLDRVAPRRWVEEAAALVQDGSVAEVPRAGHAAHYSRPGAVAALVTGFLSRAGEPATAPVRPPPAGGPPPAPTAREPGARG
jgi:pimeloyl-ACP methyl ester carboxylesterase